ncbi:Ca2+:H+ antiporter [Novosphingobium kunmingense]|uniref:Ca2+:H+ antiporter n=1 Tax=Novosphingobium kunmingense TaxID=1211806 RepID=A0A2N0I426_9SPHN|nr:ionic transporter y4hA [Novosphingobium kunmingense]PKB25923.1 Ca2+:H+ antiporter [Novosphingobium kunmingense]
MASALPETLPRWTIAAPLLGLVAIAVGTPANVVLAALVAVVLMAAVLAAVHHAEVIAHHLGEPFGTLVLAVAVTVIEASLIISLMLSNSGGEAALARDTVFAALMIVLNGIVGICLLAGGTRHHEQQFTQTGVSAGLAMLATLAILTLVLPNYTVSTPGPFYNDIQLTFVAVVSLIIYATFVLAQTVRHREYFLPDGAVLVPETPDPDDAKALDTRALSLSGGLLLIALVGVVLLAKALSPLITGWVDAAGAPRALVGVIIAGLVLLPEGLAAWRAARRNQLQTSLNLALGSALATIALTLPAVAVVAIMLGLDLALGLSPVGTVMLLLTLFVSSLSLGTGRTTIVQGVLHLVLLATFLVVTLMP